MKRLSYLFLCFVLSVVVFSCDKEDKIVPVISGLEITPVAPKPGEAVTVKATVTTPEGAPVTVELEYKVNNGSPSNVSMSNGGSGDVYSGTIPAQSQYGALIEYTVSASNKHGEAEKKSDSYTLPSESELHPVISNFGRTPQEPEPGDAVVISATVISPAGTTNLVVVLEWQVGDDDTEEVPMSNGGSGDVYSATIPGQGQSGNGAEVSYTIYATNNFGTTTSSSSYSIPEVELDYSKLILNEVSGEHKYVEIFNSAKRDIPLEGIRLQRNDGPTAVPTGSEWVGTADDVIPAGAYRLFLFNTFTPANKDNITYPSGEATNNGDAIYNGLSTLVDKETGLNTYAEFVGWGINSGISDQQILKVALVDPSGEPIDVFIRGDEPLPAWGTGGAERKREYSYSRMSDGAWANAEPTPGAENGLKVLDIENPGYLTAQPEPPYFPDDEYYAALRLNEVNGFDNEKWFEIYNTGDVEINLEGVEAWYDNVTNGYRISWTGEATDIIPAKGWFATPRGNGSNLGTGLSANNVNVKLQLRAPGGTTLDTYQKPAGFTPTEAEYPHLRNKAHARIPDGTGDWYYLDNNEGTPNATNGTTTEGYTKFGEEEPIDILPPPDDVDYTPLILNEISGEDAALFVEIYNSGTEDIPLTGVRLQRNNGPSGGGTEWVGAAEDVIPAGAYRIILFRNGCGNGNNTCTPEQESVLKLNPAWVGWTITGGLSDQQDLKIALVDPLGDEFNVFVRGTSLDGPFGSGSHARRPEGRRDVSYSRQSDGSWGWATATPGAVNETIEFPIQNVGYLTVPSQQ